jgi:hypothetical protein
MLSVLLAAALTAPPAPAADPLAGPSTLSARVSDPKVIRAAVDAALIQEEPAAHPNGAGTVLRGSGAPYDGLARTFSEARVPDCLHADALKNQFTPVGGIYALPFVLLAKLRGKCN